MFVKAAARVVSSDLSNAGPTRCGARSPKATATPANLKR